MFDSNRATDGDEAGTETWWVDIGEEVRAECSKRGTVTHLSVDRHSQGFVFVKFEEAAAAAAARSTLHARWFAGRLVTCDFTPEAEYDELFGL